MLPTHASCACDPRDAHAEPVLVRAADVAHQPLAWLWPGRLPAAKLTLVAGDPGLGKSLLALDVAARVTRGLPWPDGKEVECESVEGGGQERKPEEEVEGGSVEGGGQERETDEAATRSTLHPPLSTAALSGASPGSVVLLSAEDDLADTIRPRLEAAGADLSRVVILRGIRRLGPDAGEHDTPFSLARDTGLLEQAIAETGQVRLVVVDPLSAYLGGTDGHRASEVRALLGLLRDLAERQRVAVLAITHLNKNARAPVLYRASGSLAFVAAARAVWAVVRDRENPGRHLLLPVKCNLAAAVGGLGYRIVDSPAQPGTPVIAWESGAVEETAEDAIRTETGVQREKGAERAQAAEWLRRLLADGPVSVAEVRRQAVGAGLCWRTIERAKAIARVVPCHQGFGTPWHWSLPTHCSPVDPLFATSRDVANNGGVGEQWGPAKVEGSPRAGEPQDGAVAGPPGPGTDGL